jgi:hypothetical protein
MGLGSTSKRRWVGAIVIVAAVVMLICGQTVLKTSLSGVVYLAYWLVCFLLTGLAVLIAFLDVRALQYRIREEQRDLLETTLKKIEKETKAPDPKPRGARRK